MKRGKRAMLALLILAMVPFAACSGTSAAGVEKVEAFTMEPVDEESGLNRLTVQERAAERIGIETEQVGAAAPAGGDSQRTTVPYAAVIYDPQGATWVYTNPEPLVFVRHSITVDHIEGDVALLLDGPPAGTSVVTVGVAELFGMELGVGK
jgi:hypothetical protein